MPHCKPLSATLVLPLAVCAAAVLALPAHAKLPALTPEAKLKADEAAARTAWQNKVDAYKLCKSMDEVAAEYHQSAKQAGKTVAPPVATPPCPEPGPFSFTPAQPLEAAGAHSPAATATSPPSTNQTATQIQGPSPKK